jgi:drug/metabolite transporter (DMT)-like permease
MSTDLPPPLYRQSVRIGALYIIAAAALFSCVGGWVKILAQELPVAMVVFFRSAIGLIWLSPWLWQRRGFTLKTTRLRGHLVRGLAGVGAMYFFFYTLSQLPLAHAILLNFTAPLFIPVLAWFWLGEELPRKIGVALLAGFAGVVMIVQPDRLDLDPAILTGLISAVFAAFALVGIRNLTHSEPAARVVFYFGLISTVISLPTALWFWISPTPIQWAMAIAMAGFATIGQFLLTRGYASAPAGQVGYFQYSSVLFSILIGWLLWDEIPDAWTWGGAVLVLIAGVIASGYTLIGSGTAILEVYRKITKI